MYPKTFYFDIDPNSTQTDGQVIAGLREKERERERQLAQTPDILCLFRTELANTTSEGWIKKDNTGTQHKY